MQEFDVMVMKYIDKKQEALLNEKLVQLEKQREKKKQERQQNFMKKVGSTLLAKTKQSREKKKRERNN